MCANIVNLIPFLCLVILEHERVEFSKPIRNVFVKHGLKLPTPVPTLLSFLSLDQ